MSLSSVVATFYFFRFNTSFSSVFAFLFFYLSLSSSVKLRALFQVKSPSRVLQFFFPLFLQFLFTLFLLLSSAKGGSVVGSGKCEASELATQMKEQSESPSPDETRAIRSKTFATVNGRGAGLSARLKLLVFSPSRADSCRLCYWAKLTEDERCRDLEKSHGRVIAVTRPRGGERCDAEIDEEI